jgi:hypothetical protein
VKAWVPSPGRAYSGALACAHLLALLMLGVDFSIHMVKSGDSNFANGLKLFLQLLKRMVTNSDI